MRGEAGTSAFNLADGKRGKKRKMRIANEENENRKMLNFSYKDDETTKK